MYEDNKNKILELLDNALKCENNKSIKKEIGNLYHEISKIDISNIINIDIEKLDKQVRILEVESNYLMDLSYYYDPFSNYIKNVLNKRKVKIVREVNKNRREEKKELLKIIVDNLENIYNNTKDIEHKKEAKLYLDEFKERYELYLNNKVLGGFDAIDLYDFAEECFMDIDVVEYAEKVQFTLEKLVWIINNK